MESSQYNLEYLIELLRKSRGHIRIVRRATYTKAQLFTKENKVIFITTNQNIIDYLVNHPKIKRLEQNFDKFGDILTYSDPPTQPITVKAKVLSESNTDLDINPKQLQNFSNYHSPLYILWSSLGVSERTAQILTIKRIYPEQLDLDRLKKILTT